MALLCCLTANPTLSHNGRVLNCKKKNGNTPAYGIKPTLSGSCRTHELMKLTMRDLHVFVLFSFEELVQIRLIKGVLIIVSAMHFVLILFM